MIEIYIVIGYILKQIEAPTFLKVVWWIMMALRIFQTLVRDYIGEE